MKVLVTGAEEHQGLAVIRGLGLKGVPVVACGAEPKSLGFYSKFTVEHHVYPSQHGDRRRFVDAILRILDSSGAGMVINSLETTLVVLDSVRDEIEKKAILATPDSGTLEIVVDKLKTYAMARELGIPVPRTICGENAGDLLDRARGARFPVAVKPQGSPLHPATQHRLGFKVRYANTHEQLAKVLEETERRGALPVVQEYVPGIGVCIAAMYDKGRRLAHLPYMRVREHPLTGGISVVRKTLPPNETMSRYVDMLMDRLRWHGVAMIEFKFDAQTSAYTLMEINGRFQASTALSVDAGVNLPWMHYALYSGQQVDPVETYAVDMHERYLRGDVMAIMEYLFGDTIAAASDVARDRLPSRARALGRFLWDFRPGVKYDEFKTWDWRPGAIEVPSLVRHTLRRAKTIAGRRARRLLGRSG